MVKITSLLLVLLFAKMTMAAPFLSSSEAQEINQYMDDICMDTYCGGDINFYAQGVECSSDSKCSITYLARTWREALDTFDVPLLRALQGKTKKFYSLNSRLYFGNYEVISEEGELFAQTTITCSLYNLNAETLMGEYEGDKQEYLYMTILDSCIGPIESLILNF